MKTITKKVTNKENNRLQGTRDGDHEEVQSKHQGRRPCAKHASNVRIQLEVDPPPPPLPSLRLICVSPSDFPTSHPMTTTPNPETPPPTHLHTHYKK